MGQINQDYIEDYIRGLLPKRNDLLNRLEIEAAEEHVPIIHPEVAQYLEVMVRSHDYKKILEIGTAIGYSAIRFASIHHAMQVDSVELSEEMIEKAEKNIKEAGLENQIKIHPGDASQVIKTLEGPYDMIFLDGAKGHYVHMLEDCLRLLSPKGMIISDNVLFRGMVASNTVLKRRKITIVKRMRRFLEEISADPRIHTTIIPLGDGVAVSIWNRDHMENTGGEGHE
ncbi:O-methyltransferase [Alkalibacter rhizosphaerae]|uniref:tRNA 5-hydroxyuridine methyltransferase n=1 Tax=Alkalibacter rhizosphaerae TaxID=2815577 RepID=A0A975AHI8_9FIRM|nr:O-methyltransferase [Alkalibacter rhizosphaerae]QSX08659.1 O-methyltransferase [Alkalibacter rhizosphaerae]